MDKLWQNPLGISNFIISVIVIISDSNTRIGCFADDINNDYVIVVSLTQSITVHFAALSITLPFISGDSLSYHNNQQFSTKDRDNDEWPVNCAVGVGAWWFKHCHYSDLNGKYFKVGTLHSAGIVWFHWKNSYYSLKRVNMKIKPNPV